MNLNSEGLIIPGKSKIELLPYKKRPFVDYELIKDHELINYIGDDFIVDIEAYKNYYLCAFLHIKTNKIILLEIWKDQTFNPMKLSWIMHNFRTIGFNSARFDVPIIWLSYYIQDVEVLFEAVEDLILKNMWIGEFKKKYKLSIPPTRHIDMIDVCPLDGSLKLYGARLHTRRLQDLPFPPHEELKDWQRPIVANYCCNDLTLTAEIYIFNKDRMDLRESMSIEYNDDLMSKSDAQMAETVIGKEIYRISGKYPKKPLIQAGTQYKYKIPQYMKFHTPVLQNLLEKVREGIFTVNTFGRIDMPDCLNNRKITINQSEYRLGIGGLHSSESSVSYKASENIMLIDRDVASYYPRIIVTQELYPQHIGPDFLKVYNDLIRRRLEAKKAKNKAVDKGMKVAINGSFGKLGSMYSILFSPDLMIQVTVSGQLSLLMLIEMFELSGIQVISANTDGIVSIVHKDKYDDFMKCVEYWEKITGFTTEETRYKEYYARDVNAYFALGEDNSVKVKGPYSEVGSQTGTQLDNNPITLICSDAIKKLLIDNIPIEKTIYECKDITRFLTVRNVKGGAHKDREYLGKVVRWYYAKGEYGTINYISSGNKVANTEGAKPIMDLPESFPNDIDYQKYINLTIETLYDINYLKKPSLNKLF